jgi:hypothetical protein
VPPLKRNFVLLYVPLYYPLLFKSEVQLGQHESEKKLQNAHLTRAQRQLKQQDTRRLEKEQARHILCLLVVLPLKLLLTSSFLLLAFIFPQKSRDRLERRRAELERQQNLLDLQSRERNAAEQVRQKNFEGRKHAVSGRRAVF